MCSNSASGYTRMVILKLMQCSLGEKYIIKKLWKCALHEHNSAGYCITGKNPLFPYSKGVLLGLCMLITTLSPHFTFSSADPLLGLRDCFFVAMHTNERPLTGHHDPSPPLFPSFPFHR